MNIRALMKIALNEGAEKNPTVGTNPSDDDVFNAQRKFKEYRAFVNRALLAQDRNALASTVADHVESTPSFFELKRKNNPWIAKKVDESRDMPFYPGLAEGDKRPDPSKVPISKMSPFYREMTKAEYAAQTNLIERLNKVLINAGKNKMVIR